MSYPFAHEPWFTEGLAKSLHPSLHQIPFDALEQHSDALIQWAGEMAERDPKRDSSYRALIRELKAGIKGTQRFAPDIRYPAEPDDRTRELSRQVFAALIAGGKHVSPRAAAHTAMNAAAAYFRELPNG